MNEMLRRQRAAQATVDRFRGVPFAYGKNDCARLAAFALRQMGHKPGLAKAGSYSSALGAARALKRLGHDDLASALDALGLLRIPPIAALPSDLVMLPGVGAFGGAIAMAVGNGRVLGYHEDLGGADILEPIEFVGAWRI
ncbi:DUF6950 family protein [Sphingomonas sanguinis]|uniref:DUF6950 domain-containing protein n=1 Tax=Sphingomonas sanguinis TaxID=33051 RepID=A0A147HYU9_9SPHN|nr:hypothetical protein [Sphingomonas sanguinis]KTT70171.1 hypothetical protein NS319_08495 [Sphingomonas sanguinis]